MRSFVKIKSSRIGEITLSFTRISHPCHEFSTPQICVLTLFAKINCRENFRINSSLFCKNYGPRSDCSRVLVFASMENDLKTCYLATLCPVIEKNFIRKTVKRLQILRNPDIYRLHENLTKSLNYRFSHEVDPLQGFSWSRQLKGFSRNSLNVNFSHWIAQLHFSLEVVLFQSSHEVVQLQVFLWNRLLEVFSWKS